MSQSMVMLHVRPQPGLLMRLTAALAHFGLHVVWQQQQALDVQGLSQLSLALKGDRQVDGEVRTALLAVKGVVQCPDSQAATLDEASLQQLLRAAFAKIEAAFPRELTPVREFGLELEPNQRQRALHALGRQLGRRKYRAEYAEGSPLPLAQALQRVVAHAFRAITALEILPDKVALPDCPLCDKQPGGRSSCAFLAGLIQGLLEDSPATRGVTVAVTQCRASGQPNHHTCVCSVHPAAN